MQQIIALKQPSSKGKSSTIKALASLFITTFPDFNILLEKGNIQKSKDIRLIIIFNINGKKVIVAFDSKGDPNQNLDGRLIKDITLYKADIIFTACRSSGETYKQVIRVADAYQYSLVFTAPYESLEQNNFESLNHLKAKHLLQLSYDLNLI